MIKELLDYIFSTKWMAHKMCFLGDYSTMALNIIGDAAYALAYFLIPLGLFLWLLKQGEAILRPYKLLIFGFAAFIFFCGVSHIFDIIVLYYPVYRLEAYEKLIGGAISLFVGWFLFRPQFRKTKIISYVLNENKIATEIQLPIVRR